MKRALLILLALLCACTGGKDVNRRAVVLWHAYQGDERAALEHVVAQIQEDNPDLKIKLQSVPYDAFADKISNAVPNGNGPDLFIFAHDRIGNWVASGLIEPIEYFVDEPLANLYAYDAIAAMSYDGSLYGLPLAVKSVVLYYRTDMVAKPPRTTDELLTWGQQFKRDHKGRFALVYENQSLYGHAPWLHGFGGHVFNAEGKLDLATPAAIQALELARTLGKTGLVPLETRGAMIASFFNEGEAAMAISGPWFIGEIAKDVPWAVTSLPKVSKTGRHAAPFLGAEGVLMSVRARDKELAFRVMQALAGDRSAIHRARKARQVVPNQAAYDEQDIGSDQVLAAFREQLQHSVPMPATPAMRMVWAPYKSALQKVIAQGANPADALLRAQRDVHGYLRGAKIK
jgi:maltose-binding protein MalE